MAVAAGQNRPGHGDAQRAAHLAGGIVDAASSSYLVMAAIVGVAAVLIPLFAPGRDGRQLRAMRTLRNRRTATP